MELTIRKVRLEDIDQVSNIESACFPPEEAAELKTLEDRIKVFPDSFFVAEEDGRVVGFVNGCVSDGLTITDDLFHSTSSHNPLGETQTIFGLDVHPDFQKQGIARLLLNQLIKEAQASKRKRVILTCKNHLLRYYESFGFVNQGLSQSTHGGAVWYDMTLTF